MQALLAMVSPSMQGGLDDLAGFDALGADPNALDAAIHHGAHPLQIGQPAAFGQVVRVAHIVTVARFLATNFTNSRHLRSPVDQIGLKKSAQIIIKSGVKIKKIFGVAQKIWPCGRFRKLQATVGA